MNLRTASVAAGVGYLLAVVVYAVLAGIAPTPVSDPTPRIPGFLFVVVVPAVAAFLLGAGSTLGWLRFGLRAPGAGLVLGSLLAVLVAPTQDVAWTLLLGGFGWLTLLGAGELLCRVAGVRSADGSLTPDERAGATGALVGLAYAAVFTVAAVRPAWTGAADPSAPGAVEAVLTLAFLAGAFCLLFGVPVALALRHRLVTPLVVPAFWLAQDVLSGWGNYVRFEEFATVWFLLVWPGAMLAVVGLAVVESLLRAGWRRGRGTGTSTADDSRGESTDGDSAL